MHLEFGLFVYGYLKNVNSRLIRTYRQDVSQYRNLPFHSAVAKHSSASGTQKEKFLTLADNAIV